jgi:hypothetical protein
MRKLFSALLLLGAIALPSQAQLAWKPTFVSYSTFTAPGAGNYAWALKNTSTVYEVRVEKIEVGSCNDGTAVSGGLAQFELYAASALTSGGTVQVSTYALNSDTFPANVVASTGPVGITIEHKGTRQNPLLSPFIVNNDETATADFVVSRDLRSERTLPIILPRDGSRAIALKQKKVGTGDITAGCNFARVEFTTK